MGLLRVIRSSPAGRAAHARKASAPLLKGTLLLEADLLHPEEGGVGLDGVEVAGQEAHVLEERFAGVGREDEVVRAEQVAEGGGFGTWSGIIGAGGGSFAVSRCLVLMGQKPSIGCCNDSNIG